MIPKRIVALVLERDGGRCVVAGPRCLGAASLAHHRANRGAGGSKVLDDPRNLVACCGLCNSYVEDSTGQARAVLVEHGHRVLQAGTNAKTLTAAASKPVRYPDGTWWFLLPDGTRQEITEPDF